jgi:hypothetical protein
MGASTKRRALDGGLDWSGWAAQLRRGDCVLLAVPTPAFRETMWGSVRDVHHTWIGARVTIYEVPTHGFECRHPPAGRNRHHAYTGATTLCPAAPRHSRDTPRRPMRVGVGMPMTEPTGPGCGAMRRLGWCGA